MCVKLLPPNPSLATVMCSQLVDLLCSRLVVGPSTNSANPLDLGLGSFEPALGKNQVIIIQSEEHRSLMRRCFEGQNDVVVYLDGTHNATKYKMEMVSA